MSSKSYVTNTYNNAQPRKKLLFSKLPQAEEVQTSRPVEEVASIGSPEGEALVLSSSSSHEETPARPAVTQKEDDSSSVDSPNHYLDTEEDTDSQKQSDPEETEKTPVRTPPAAEKTLSSSSSSDGINYLDDDEDDDETEQPVEPPQPEVKREETDDLTAIVDEPLVMKDDGFFSRPGMGVSTSGDSASRMAAEKDAKDTTDIFRTPNRTENTTPSGTPFGQNHLTSSVNSSSTHNPRMPNLTLNAFSHDGDDSRRGSLDVLNSTARPAPRGTKEGKDVEVDLPDLKEDDSTDDKVEKVTSAATEGNVQIQVVEEMNSDNGEEEQPVKPDEASSSVDAGGSSKSSSFAADEYYLNAMRAREEEEARARAEKARLAEEALLAEQAKEKEEKVETQQEESVEEKEEEKDETVDVGVVEEIQSEETFEEKPPEAEVDDQSEKDASSSSVDAGGSSKSSSFAADEYYLNAMRVREEEEARAKAEKARLAEEALLAEQAAAQKVEAELAEEEKETALPSSVDLKVSEGHSLGSFPAATDITKPFQDESTIERPKSSVTLDTTAEHLHMLEFLVGQSSDPSRELPNLSFLIHVASGKEVEAPVLQIPVPQVPTANDWKGVTVVTDLPPPPQAPLPTDPVYETPMHILTGPDPEEEKEEEEKEEEKEERYDEESFETIEEEEEKQEEEKKESSVTEDVCSSSTQASASPKKSDHTEEEEEDEEEVQQEYPEYVEEQEEAEEEEEKEEPKQEEPPEAVYEAPEEEPLPVERETQQQEYQELLEEDEKEPEEEEEEEEPEEKPEEAPLAEEEPEEEPPQDEGEECEESVVEEEESYETISDEDTNAQSAISDTRGFVKPQDTTTEPLKNPSEKDRPVTPRVEESLPDVETPKNEERVLLFNTQHRRASAEGGEGNSTAFFSTFLPLDDVELSNIQLFYKRYIEIVFPEMKLMNHRNNTSNLHTNQLFFTSSSTPTCLITTPFRPASSSGSASNNVNTPGVIPSVDVNTMDFNKMIPSTRSHQLQVAGALQDFINNIDISTTKWAQQLLHFEKCFEVNFLQVIGEMDVDGRVNETATQLYNLYQRYNRTTARRGSSSKEQHSQRQFYFRALSFEEAVQFGMYAKYIKTTLNNKFHEDYFEGITPSEGDSSHAHPYNTTTHRFSSEIPRPVSPENELLDKDLQEVIHHFRDKPRPSAAGGHRRVQSPLPTTATSSIINNLSNTTEREETTTGPELPMRRPLRPASAGKPGGKQARRRPTLTYSDVTEPHADAAPVVLENRNDNTEQHTLPHTEDGLILSAFNELAKESNVEGKKTVKIAEVLFLLKKNFDIVANLTPLHGIEIDKSFKGEMSFSEFKWLFEHLLGGGDNRVISLFKIQAGAGNTDGSTALRHTLSNTSSRHNSFSNNSFNNNNNLNDSYRAMYGNATNSNNASMNKPTADEYPSLQPNTNCATLFRNVRNAILNHARSHHASNYNNSPNDSALHHSPPSKPPPSPFRTTRHTVTVENVQPLIPPKKEPEEVKLAAPQETVAPRPTGAKKPQRPHSALPGGISPTRVQHLGDVVAGPAGRSLRHGGLKNNYTRETNPRANRYISTYPKREVSPKKPANRGNEEYHQHSSTAYAVRQRKNYMQQSTPYDTVNQGNASTNRSSKVRKLFSRRGFYAPMPWDSTTKVDYVENVKGGFRPSRQNSPSGNTSNNNVSRLDGQRTSPSRKTSPNKPSTAYSSVKKPARRPQSATLHRTKEFYLQDTQTPDEYVVYSAGGQSSIKQTPTSQGEENIFVVNNKYTKYILECQNHKILVENELRQLYIAKSALEEKLKEVNRQQKQQNRMGNAAYVNQHHTVTEYNVQDILNTLNELKQNVIHHLRLLSAIQKREKELKLLEKEYFHKKSRAANGQPAEDPNIPSMEEIMTLLAESNTKIKENNGSHGVNDSSEVQRTLFRGATPISQIQ